MIKHKIVTREPLGNLEQTSRVASKLGKKNKPKYQSIIRALKGHIEALEKEVEIQDTSRDREIRKLEQIVLEQAQRIRSLDFENTKLITRLKAQGDRREHLNVESRSKYVLTSAGNTQRLDEYSSLRNKNQSRQNFVKMTDRTPRNAKEHVMERLPAFSRSTLDMIGHSPLPYRFNLSSEIEVPLVNVFNTQTKDNAKESRIVGRSLKSQNRVKNHKCNNRCHSKMEDYL